MVSRRKFLISTGSALGAMVLTPRGIAGEPQESPLFSFIFCNDLHIETETEAAYLGEAVDDWNRIAVPYDFVVAGGDLSENYGGVTELGRCKEQMDLLAKPWYPVIGNHDVSGTGEAGKADWRAVFGTGRENYYVEHKGVGLIFLDLSDGTAYQHTRVPQATLDWLTALLATLPAGLPLIVYNHYPLLDLPMQPEPPGDGWQPYSSFVVSTPEKIFDLLDSRNVLAYFAGHWHGGYHGIRNNAHFYGNVCLALSKTNSDGDPLKGYLWADVFADRVDVTFLEKGTQPSTAVTGRIATRPCGNTAPALSARPNPLRGRVTVRFSMPGETRGVYTLFNAAGRKIRTFPIDGSMSGALQWDGRDGRGVPAAAGPYIGRLVTQSGKFTEHRLLLVK